MIVLRSRSSQKTWVRDAAAVLEDFGIPHRWEKSSRSELVWSTAGVAIHVPETARELERSRGLTVAVGGGTNAALWVSALIAPKKVRAYRKALTERVMKTRNVTSALRR